MGNAGLTANLGSTNKFFMPWLIPRNDRNSVFRPNFFGKLAGRTKRDEYNDLNTIEKGKQIAQAKVISNTVPFHLNKGCMYNAHTHLKCNIVTFEIPKSFPWYRNPFGISKFTRLHFKWVCTVYNLHTSFIQVNYVDQKGVKVRYWDHLVKDIYL